jgi:zinc and cadmium transporter
LAIPLGVGIFYFGLMREAADASGDPASLIAAYALSFSAGTFLCIASSDLLPELQFHQHDRVKLSAALVLGLAVAMAVAKLEQATNAAHQHGNSPLAPSPPARPSD